MGQDKLISIMAVLVILLTFLSEYITWAPWVAAEKLDGQIWPGSSWSKVDKPERIGWSSEKLALARGFSESMGSAAVVIVENGVIVDAWGDIEADFQCHSVRKSLISAMYGIQVDKGVIDLSRTMGELDINDFEPGLSDLELTAEVGDLIRARSGIYHPALGESQGMRDRRPPRYSRAPGEYWYYNNWDFNALGTIYEQETGVGLFEDFDRLIARPLGMEDFSPKKCWYNTEEPHEENPRPSMHRYYGFRMSSRDLARFGLMYLKNGTWRDKQIVPADWVQLSTDTHSVIGPEKGYGFMWWIGAGRGLFPGVHVREHSYYASGYRGHRLIILPYRNLVIVHRVDTDHSDVHLNDRHVGGLLWLILDAAGETNIGEPPFIERAGGVRLTADNIGELLGDKGISYVHGRGRGRIRAFIRPDGTITLKSPDSADVLAMGRWWFEGDIFCESFDTRPEKIERFRVIIDQSYIKVYDLNGLLIQNIDRSGI